MRSFYDHVPCSLAGDEFDWRTRFEIMVRLNKQGHLMAYKHGLDGEFLGEERIRDICKGTKDSEWIGTAFGVTINFY